MMCKVLIGMQLLAKPTARGTREEDPNGAGPIDNTNASALRNIGTLFDRSNPAGTSGKRNPRLIRTRNTICGPCRKSNKRKGPGKIADCASPLVEARRPCTCTFSGGSFQSARSGNTLRNFAGTFALFLCRAASREIGKVISEMHWERLGAVYCGVERPWS